MSNWPLEEGAVADRLEQLVKDIARAGYPAFAAGVSLAFNQFRTRIDMLEAEVAQRRDELAVKDKFVTDAIAACSEAGNLRIHIATLEEALLYLEHWFVSCGWHSSPELAYIRRVLKRKPSPPPPRLAMS